MSVHSNMISEDGGLSAQVNFPLPLNDTGLTLGEAGAPISAEVEDRREDIFDTEAFHRPIDIPKLKKYYVKLEKRICIWLIFAQTFMLGMLFMGINIMIKAWDQTSAIDPILGWVSSVASNTGLKCATCGFVSGILWMCLKNVERLRFKKKYIVHENNLCKMMYYPTALTPASAQNVLSMFSWRLNLYWIGFALVGLGLNVLAVSNGWYLYQHYSTQSALFYWDKFQKFIQFFENIKSWDVAKMPDRLLDISLFLCGGGLALIFLTNPWTRICIKNALDVFNLTEYNMGAELRDSVFRINKRNKILTLILLCITGLPTFLILKRLIIAVFNKSFKYSKR